MIEESYQNVKTVDNKCNTNVECALHPRGKFRSLKIGNKLG